MKSRISIFLSHGTSVGEYVLSPIPIRWVRNGATYGEKFIVESDVV